MNEEEVKKLLEENLALAKETRLLAAKTQNYIKWLRAMDFVKVAIIIIPIIAAWLYLPDIIGMLSSAYGDILPPGLLK